MEVAAEKVLKLSNLAVSAAMQPQLWQRFLDEISVILGTQVCAQLIGYDEQTSIAPLAFSSGYDPDILRLYAAHYATKNPFAENFGKVPVGKTVSCHQLVDTKALQQTAFYDDLLRPLEDIYCGGGSMLALDAERMFLIGGNMRAKDQDKFEHAWLKLCADLTPVLRQSLEISRAISGLSFEKWAAEQHKLGSKAAILAIDGDMRLQFACAQAQDLLAEGNLIRTGLGRKLYFPSEAAQARIAALLRFQGQRNINAFGSWKFSDTRGNQWICRASELRLDELDQSPFGAFLTNSVSGMLLAIKREETASSLREVVRRLTGLSGAEAETAVMLSEGRTLTEIADERNVSIYTVRNQIKAALAKTGCRRQSDLVRKIEQVRAQAL